MFLNELELINYKNLTKKLKFSVGVNLIVAPNGTGKTNVLEAIAYLALGDSFRKIPDSEVMPYEKVVEFTSILGKIGESGKAGKDQVQIVWSDDSKGNGKLLKNYIHNGKTTNQAKLKRLIRVLVHAPDTLDLVTGTADVRRNFIDTGIKLLRPGYASLLRNYSRVVRSKSSVLENFQGRESELYENLHFWNLKLAKLTAQITHERLSFLSAIMPVANEIAKRIYHLKNVELAFRLESKYLTTDNYQELELSQIEESLLEKLKSGLEKEFRAMRSLYGAHRDDYVFTLSEKNLRFAASRGQQRLFSLVVHLAILEFLEAEHSDRFIILLDDILSELDEVHKQRTLDYLQEIADEYSHQVIITSADKREFPKDILDTVNWVDLS